MKVPKTHFKTDLQFQKEKDIEWSRRIKERDGWACAICKDKIKPNAHHLIPREVKQYRYDLENGLTLCVNHHKFSRIISAHQAPFAFFFWLQQNRKEQFDYIKRILDNGI